MKLKVLPLSNTSGPQSVPNMKKDQIQRPKNLAANRFLSKRIASNHLEKTIQNLDYRKLEESRIMLSTYPLVYSQRITLKVNIFLFSLNYYGICNIIRLSVIPCS